MTDPENDTDDEGTCWTQPELTIRVVYDESGRVNAVTTEYRHVPAAEDIARLVAQFLTIRPGGLPNRVPGVNLPRDPRLEREFRAVLGIMCGATTNVITGAARVLHDTHVCVKPQADHAPPHQCDCGVTFGG